MTCFPHKITVHNWVNTVKTHYDKELCIENKAHYGSMHDGWSFALAKTGFKSLTTADINVVKSVNSFVKECEVNLMAFTIVFLIFMLKK